MKINILSYTFFLIFFSVASVFSKEVAPLAKNGVLDLRDQTMDQTIPLNGEWKFYWQKLIIPNDTTKGITVPFPEKWNDFSIDGKKLPAFGYATYSLKLLMPKSVGNLRIAMPDVYCAYR
ncbi:MAG: ATPase, partial [Flavobacterium sp.]